LETERFIVSLGTFQRQRFPDFTVTAQDGSRCHLLSRRQHGYCLAICMIRPFLYDEEWGLALNSPRAAIALDDLRIYLSGMITTVPSHPDYTPGGASMLFVALLVSLGIDLKRIDRAAGVFRVRCTQALVGTQYLCWIDAKAGTTIQLYARYTRADTPQTRDESDIVRPEKQGLLAATFHRMRQLRLAWRNTRSRWYAYYNVFPVRYSIATPAYDHCGSYYFTIRPPDETQITLLDWRTGRRFRRKRSMSGRSNKRMARARRKRSPSNNLVRVVDCADFAYHFHNRRTPGGSETAKPGAIERRRTNAPTGTEVHAFLRSEPIDNAKLVAVGFLSLCLAAFAGSGALSPSNSTGTSQWLLLAPAALVLFVGQQRHHHYAYFTRPFRLLIWAYIVFAMLFAGSTVFDLSRAPLLSESVIDILPSVASGMFAIASLIVIIAFAWSGSYFDWVTRRRYRRVIQRVHLFGTPSLGDTLWRYRWRPKYWRKPMNPLSAQEISPWLRSNHPSDKIYAAIARHAIDRVIAITFGLAATGVVLMLLLGWGKPEECVITKAHAQQLASEKGKAIGSGRCVNGVWSPYPQQTVSVSGTAGIRAVHSKYKSRKSSDTRRA
jgi:hypothetical protein